MVSIVNGYLCRCDCDVALARRGVNPQNPTGDPARTRDGEPAKAGASTARGPAVLRDALAAGGGSPAPVGLSSRSGAPAAGTLVDRTA